MLAPLPSTWADASGGTGLNWWTHLLHDEIIAHTAPDTLSIDDLITLQASLLAKMMFVNKEIHARYADVLASTDEKPSNVDARHVLTRAAAHLEALNRILRDELGHVLSQKPV